MTTLEMVEKLMQRANVSYEEAKTALDSAGGDLLDALILLEREGRVAPPQGGGYYSTQEQNGGGGENGEPNHRHTDRNHHGEGLKELLGRFVRWLSSLIEKGNQNSFEVWKDGKQRLSVPVTVLVVVLIFCFYAVLPLMIVGLFFGCKYRFSGAELSGVNGVMDTAAKVADDIKTEVKNMGGGE